MSHSVVVYSTTWCPDCVTAKTVLKAMDVEFEEINIEEHPEAVSKVLALNNGNRSVPTIVFPDGSVLTEPGVMELRGKLKSLA